MKPTGSARSAAVVPLKNGCRSLSNGFYCCVDMILPVVSTVTLNKSVWRFARHDRNVDSRDLSLIVLFIELPSSWEVLGPNRAQPAMRMLSHSCSSSIVLTVVAPRGCREVTISKALALLPGVYCKIVV